MRLLRRPPVSARATIVRVAFLTCVALATALTTSEATAQNPVEYKIKSSLIYNFLKFIEWPPDSVQDTLQLCIVSKQPYGNALDQLAGELVQGKRIAVDLLSSDNSNSCHVVIFSGEDTKRVTEVFSAISNKPVLTIGESDGFISNGGILNFKIVNETVQFQINQGRAKQSRLAISSKLLRLAYSVEE